jgi:hypothetical protein
MLKLAAKFIVAAIAATFCGVATAADVSDVVATARSYSDGGGYEWKGTGVPEEIRFGQHKILGKGKATYCSGFTFAVVMKAAAARGLFADKTYDEVRRFQKAWYGSTEESAETQCVFALEKLKIGRAVKVDDAQAGDFLQLWRTNKSGHSVVFLEWVNEGGRRVGLKYRSTQKSTDGIGDRVEYFASETEKKGAVDPKRLYFGRLDETRKRGRGSH